MTEWKTWEDFSRYEASHRGLIRRSKDEYAMALTPDKDTYFRITLTRDDGERVNLSVARCVLTAHDRPPEPGEEACHGPGGKQDNRWPENLRWDDRAGNEREKVEAGNGPRPNPTYPCKDGCGNLVINEGRRCVECVDRVKVESAAMLNRRINLWDVAEHFGYSGVDWVFKLAVEGGYTGTKREALTQQPRLSQRVAATVRDRFRLRRGGDAA